MRPDPETILVHHDEVVIHRDDLEDLRAVIRHLSRVAEEGMTGGIGAPWDIYRWASIRLTPGEFAQWRQAQQNDGSGGDDA